MEQVQCPSCGGYKVITTPVQIEQNSEQRRLPQNPLLSLIGIVGVLCGFILIPIGFIAGVMGNGIILFIGIIGFVLSLVVALAVKSTIPKSILVTLSYSNVCKICGYRWNWVVGTPRPEVKVNPHLIRQGGEHLKEQERQSRKAQGLE
jgi:hypothetical protein